MKRLSILGSTGSIGRNVLAIVERFPDRFAVSSLTAKGSIDLLARQIEQFHPEIAVVHTEDLARDLAQKLGSHSDVSILWGDDGYRRAASHESADTVVAAMVGAAGLVPTLAAISAGKDIALANKETLVMAGELVMNAAARAGVNILPIDSEHSAIFQCLQGNRRQDLDRILLTGSGGPFRTWPKARFDTITVEDALKHPNWQMGKKITIDSSTLMNKGLEVIEAKWLFDVPTTMIQVLIHPQSIVHSMVSYKDGSVIAQMGIPDMKGAIAYALSFPERLPLNQPLPDFIGIGQLGFEAPDTAKFPCLALAFDACQTGYTMPAVLNAANEVAVDAFLNGRISHVQIPQVIRQAMGMHTVIEHPTLSHILEADRTARKQAAEVIGALGTGKRRERMNFDN